MRTTRRSALAALATTALAAALAVVPAVPAAAAADATFRAPYANPTATSSIDCGGAATGCTAQQSALGNGTLSAHDAVDTGDVPTTTGRSASSLAQVAVTNRPGAQYLDITYVVTASVSSAQAAALSAGGSAAGASAVAQVSMPCGSSSPCQASTSAPVITAGGTAPPTVTLTMMLQNGWGDMLLPNNTATVTVGLSAGAAVAPYAPRCGIGSFQGFFPWCSLQGGPENVPYTGSASVDATVVVTGITATYDRRPAPPQHLAPASGDHRVALSWGAAPSAARLTSYVLSRDGTRLATLSPSTTSYTDTGLTNGQLHVYDLVATNAYGSSDPAEMYGVALTAPTPPVNFVARIDYPGTASQSGSVTLSWDRPVDDGGNQYLSYAVYRATSATSSGQLLYTDDSSTAASDTYWDVGAVYGQTYWYHVVAESSMGNSSTPTVSALGQNTKPDAPTGVTATPGDGQITVSWQASVEHGSPVTGYDVLNDGNGQTPCHVDAGVHSCTITGLQNGYPYWFGVRAVSAAGDGPEGSAPQTSPQIDPTTPWFGASSQGSSIKLWIYPSSTTPSNAKVSFVIFRSNTPGGETEYATVAATSTSPSTPTIYTDTDIVRGLPYFYQVAEVVNGVESPRTKEATVYTT